MTVTKSASLATHGLLIRVVTRRLLGPIQAARQVLHALASGVLHSLARASL
jgi:hypothetical protein